MSSKKRKLDPLSKFEWTIMDQVWDNGKRTVREVHEALPPEKQRAYTTIQTYMERLVDKGYLQKEKIGLVNFYLFTVPREQVVEGETSRFVTQVFGGSASRLAAYLLPNIDLEPEAVEQIRHMLEEAEQSNDE